MLLWTFVLTLYQLLILDYVWNHCLHVISLLTGNCIGSKTPEECLKIKTKSMLQLPQCSDRTRL